MDCQCTLSHKEQFPNSCGAIVQLELLLKIDGCVRRLRCLYKIQSLQSSRLLKKSEIL